MGISADKAWDNGTVTDDTTQTITVSGTATAAGAMILLFLMYRPGSSFSAPATPSGFTLDKSLNISQFVAYIFRQFAAASKTTISVTLNAAPAGGCVHLHMRSFTSGNSFVLDQAPTINHTTGTTTLATSTQTTTGASASTNDICVSGFAQTSAAGSTPTWNTPTNSYSLTGSRLSDNDGTSQTTTGIYTKIISANVTSESAGVTSSATNGAIEPLVSYTETAAAPSGGPFPHYIRGNMSGGFVGMGLGKLPPSGNYLSRRGRQRLREYQSWQQSQMRRAA